MSVIQFDASELSRERLVETLDREVLAGRVTGWKSEPTVGKFAHYYTVFGSKDRLAVLADELEGWVIFP